MTEKTAALDGFQDIEALAITKALPTKIAKIAREGVTPGTYAVDFECRVQGQVTVGEDYEQRMVNKAKPWNLVYALLTELNKTREAAGEAGIDIAKLIQMAETVDPALVKEAQTAAEKEAAALKAETLSPAKGKVTSKLEIMPIEG